MASIIDGQHNYISNTRLTLKHILPPPPPQAKNPVSIPDIIMEIEAIINLKLKGNSDKVEFNLMAT